jgi:hypothetical protein
MVTVTVRVCRNVAARPEARSAPRPVARAPATSLHDDSRPWPPLRPPLPAPTLFADYIRWASRAEAEAAAARLPELPGAGAFLGAIATLHSMAHLPAGAPAGGPDDAAPTQAGAR